MDVHERDVPIYAGWADSMISIADVIGLPIVSSPPSHVTPLTVLQHVRLIQRFSHRQLFVLTLQSSGTVAAVVGFCTSPWQLIALRGMTGLVHFGGFISTIALGGLVDEESRNEGQSASFAYGFANHAHPSAFSWRAAGSAIGSMSGSALGGLLAEPNGRVPILSDLQLFQIKPYAAPGVVLLLLSIIASGAVLLLVKEVSGLTNVTYLRPIPVIWGEVGSVMIPSHQIHRWDRPKELLVLECCCGVDVSGKSASRSLVSCLTSRHQVANGRQPDLRVCLSCSFGESRGKFSSEVQTTAGKLRPSIGGLGMEASH